MPQEPNGKFFPKFQKKILKLKNSLSCAALDAFGCQQFCIFNTLYAELFFCDMLSSLAFFFKIIFFKKFFHEHYMYQSVKLS